MGRPGLVATEDRDPPDLAVSRAACGDLPRGDSGGMGRPTGIGACGPRLPAEANFEDGSEPGNAGSWPIADFAGDFRRAASDADDLGTGDRRTYGGVPGFHSGVLRLVCIDGAERSQSARLGGDRWRRRRSGATRVVPHMVAGDGELDRAWSSDGQTGIVPEWLCHSRQILQLLDRRTVDVG